MVTIDQAYIDAHRASMAGIARRLEQEAARIRAWLDSSAVPPPMDIAAARHLDTVRPGPDHPTLFDGRGNICVATFGCTNTATHTVELPQGTAQVCLAHFTEWAQARPI